MKALLFIGVLVAVAQGLAPDLSVLEPLDSCVRAVEVVDAAHRGRLPETVSQLSPALKYLEAGVFHWRAELSASRARFAQREPQTVERHFLNNGNLGCEAFLNAYQAKVDSFFVLLATFGCLILVLTVRLGLAMVPATLSRANHETTSLHSPPSDRTSTGGR